jgi:hypothetical protein
MVFAGFGVVPEVFPGRIQLHDAVRMHNEHFEALFRIMIQPQKNE